MTPLFVKAAACVIDIEGSELSLDPNDRGNWTSGIIGRGELKGSKYGISAAQYPDVDIADLTVDGAREIYYKDYFLPIRGDDLPKELVLYVLDAAINSGVPRASGWFQDALGVKIDHIIGIQTVNAAQHAVASGKVDEVAVEMLAQRMLFMVQAPQWMSQKKGWTRRVIGLPFKVKQFVEN